MSEFIPSSGQLIHASDSSTAVSRIDRTHGPFDNAAVAYIMSLGSKTSRRTMTSFLNRSAAMLGAPNLLQFDWAQLRRPHIQLVMAKLQDAKRAPATINTYLAALRGVALEAWTLKQISTDDFQHIVRIKPVRGSRRGVGMALADKQMLALLAACDKDPSCKGPRDAALLAILMGCGLRRAEAVALDLEHVHWETGSLLIQGKGNTQRRAFLPDFALERLGRWVEEVRGDDPGPLFVRIRKGDDVTAERLTDQGVYHILCQRRVQAGISDVAPHDLRRSFATRLLASGEDLLTVKDALGHASVTTTQTYDLRSFRRLKAASQRFKFNSEDGLAQEEG